MNLKELIAQYVTFRQSMGDDFRGAESVLKTFGKRLGNDVELVDVKTHQVLAFLDGTRAVNRSWHRKYYVLQGFYRYAISRGFTVDSPLPTITPKPPERFVPYIYTRDELRRLFNSTDSYRKDHRKLEPLRCGRFSCFSMEPDYESARLLPSRSEMWTCPAL